MPTSAPTTIVTIVASNPMTIDTRVPQTVRLRTLRPSESVPEDLVERRRLDVRAGRRRHRLERPDEEPGRHGEDGEDRRGR